LNVILQFDGRSPAIHPSAFISDDCRIIGSVSIGELSSIWFKAVLRGDQNSIAIGARTNIQDGTIVHVPTGLKCEIGDSVTVGHNATIHGCTIGSLTLVGIGSVVLDGVKIGEGSIVAAGAVVPPGKEFPPRTLIMGTPGKAIREVTEEEFNNNIRLAETYIKLAAQYNNLKDR
jgi:carbonic anhydrase/acetyltransferase-like protein (isoleucine patch superfamily)